MKIAFLSSYDITNKRVWSGILPKMHEALKDEFPDMIVLGPVERNNWIEKLINGLTILHLKLFSGRYNKVHNIIRAKYYAKQFSKILRGQNLDLIFAPAGSTETAYLNTKIPICYLSDTSFGQIKDYYQTFSVFSALSNYESDIIEKRALSKAKHIVYSSIWAADFVKENYGVESKKLSVIPFGANIDNIPGREVLNKDYDGIIKILFVTRYWKRKGGNIVLDTFRILVNKGYNVKLTILGCNPMIEENERIEVIPFLDKNDKKQAEKFKEIFKESHLFFLPTRADCTPIVFCEANAFGMPVITTDTGGVSSIIQDGVNGYALPIDAEPGIYARQIQTLIDNPEKLEEMAFKSRERYELELNWTSWASRMKEIFTFITQS